MLNYANPIQIDPITPFKTLLKFISKRSVLCSTIVTLFHINIINIILIFSLFPNHKPNSFNMVLKSWYSHGILRRISPFRCIEFLELTKLLLTTVNSILICYFSHPRSIPPLKCVSI